jgi:hypothetical protein
LKVPDQPGFFIFSQIYFMRALLLLLFFGLSGLFVNGQSASFPSAWEGNWKGELQWFKTGTAIPQKVVMELRIHRTDSTNKFTWQIIYGSITQDNRPYTLIAKDTSGIHWIINENNGIVLDQYWVGNKFCGAFTVMNNTIVNNYWMENNKLLIEFYSIGAKPVATTGNDTDESPLVDSYKIGSYQKAVLTRQ